MIEFRDVRVCYDPQARYPIHALDGVTLRVEPGEWAFFVGPSGAGKSTLLKLVYRGALAMGGDVLVDGQCVTKMAARDVPYLRRKIGVVFQDFQLLPQKTVWENVAFALQVIGAPQKRLVRDVPIALETVGLVHKATSRPHELSGGEQQRVAIARAIVNDPKILVADEPTGNLDPETAREIARVLETINERGTTILMATHDRILVDAMRRRVVRIRDGKVISDEAQGVYHPEDDEPRASTPAAATALDGALADALAQREEKPDSQNDAPIVVSSNSADDVSTHMDEEEEEKPESAPKPVFEDENFDAVKVVNPDAPIGSPENPIIQFDEPQASWPSAGTVGSENLPLKEKRPATSDFE